ncbi:MAG: adenylyltransferase/cytidyltransferase family protein [Patescibacteria group bacterium]|nr:adenylyltransferase/cytidyltransferase family protein [Patescibacteria group bacterium]
MNEKIIPESELAVKRLTWPDDVVLVGGCFDLLHFGHFSFLKSARSQGEFLVVALEPDEFIRIRKKREPVHTQHQRAEILAGIEFVNAVILLPFYQSDSDYHGLVKQVRPKVVAVTAEDPNLKRKEMQARNVGARVVEVTPIINSFSTSSIIQYATLLGD